MIDAYKRHDWLIGAVIKRLQEEFAKLNVEINDEKSRMVDLERGERFGFLELDFLYLRFARKDAAAPYAQAQEPDSAFEGLEGGVSPTPIATDRQGDEPGQFEAPGMGELLRGWGLNRVLPLRQKADREKGQAPYRACSQTTGLLLWAVEQFVVVQDPEAVQ
ncbi:hypothetical protein ACVIYL_008917 [Bradyrhizobium sp. USDA 3315]